MKNDMKLIRMMDLSLAGKRVFIRARTKHITVYGLDEGRGFFRRYGNSVFVDTSIRF